MKSTRCHTLTAFLALTLQVHSQTVSLLQEGQKVLQSDPPCSNGGTQECSCKCAVGYWGITCDKIVTAGCEAVIPRPNAKSGVYNITINHKNVFAYCDLCENNQPWTVIQRRLNGKIDFYRNWADYANGFGDVDSEYWLGNKNIAALTNSRRYVLRVELTNTTGNSRWAEYDYFRVGNEITKFKLESLGTYSGDAGDSLRKQFGWPFSTQDSDNDNHKTVHCAVTYHGAWWYNDCHHSNLNGDYGNVKYGVGINWNHWTGFYHSLKGTVMKIRPYSD